jgi:cellulose synthase/poly-beta-1,6-N-acetylglucosamine synthase-like glycosyltransferase
LAGFKQRYPVQSGATGPAPVSVVICAHNESHHLKENLPLILGQDYPEYEVVVVDHSSDDDTHYLLRSFREQYPHLKVVTIREDLNFFTGKKFPLSIGIKSAQYEHVLLTDADCRPASGNWLSLMQSAFSKEKEIVLGYSPYTKQKGLLNRLIRFDTLHIAMQYLGFALAGIPYMGVGRNLAYKKQLFYRNNGFIAHYRIKSGDDDLFINRVAKDRNTTVMLHPDGFTFSDPKKTSGEWFTQKRRHLSTATFYRLHHKILLGLYSLTTILFYALFIILVSLQWSTIPVIALFVLRLASQYAVFARSASKLREKDLAVMVPVYEFILLVINSGCSLANLLRKPVRWK